MRLSIKQRNSVIKWNIFVFFLYQIDMRQWATTAFQWAYINDMMGIVSRNRLLIYFHLIFFFIHCRFAILHGSIIIDNYNHRWHLIMIHVHLLFFNTYTHIHILSFYWKHKIGKKTTCRFNLISLFLCSSSISINRMAGVREWERNI